MPGPPLSSFGSSATMHSVVSMRAETLAALSSAVRVTLVGSITPASIRSSNLAGLCIEAEGARFFLEFLNYYGTLFAGVGGNLAGRFLEGALDYLQAELLVAAKVNVFQ